MAVISPTIRKSHYRGLAMLAASALLLLAFGVRVQGLDHAGLHWDEGYSYWIIRLPVGDLFQATALDIHPPLYYLLLRGAQAVFGDDVFALRYLSVLAGLLTAAGVFALGRLIGGYGVGVLALLLIAVSRVNIDLSQLMRMQVLAGTFATLGLWGAVRLWRQPTWHVASGAALTYLLAVIAGLYTFYLAVILPLAANLIFVLAWWRRGRSRDLLLKWSALHVIAALAFLPWIVYALRHMPGASPGEGTTFAFFTQVYFVVLTAGVTTDWGPYLPWVALTLLTIGAGTLLIIRRASREQRDHLALLLLSVLIPLLIVFLMTLPIHNLGRPLAARYLLVLAAGFYVLAAWSVAALMQRQRFVGLLAGLLIAGVGIIGLIDSSHTQAPRDLYTSIGRTLTAHRQSGDVVILHNDADWPLFVTDYTGPWDYVPFRVAVDGAYTEALLAPLWSESDAVWLVEQPGAQLNDPQHLIAGWLRERAIHSESWRFNDNQLTLFVREPARLDSLHQVGPDAIIPTTSAHPEIGLLGIEPPLRRTWIGTSLHLAFYWQQPPTRAVTLELASDRHHVTFSADKPPVTGDIVRQPVRLPLTPDMPPGRYRLSLIEPERLQLAEITLVSRLPSTDIDEGDIPNPLGWSFHDDGGPVLRLLGFDINQATFRPGNLVEVTLYWRADAVVSERYKMGVYALGEAFNPRTNNPLWGQHDAEPLNWQYPTTQWPPATIIADRQTFHLDDNTPRGTYQIGVVVYGLLDGQRLRIHDADGDLLGDMATLVTATVR